MEYGIGPFLVVFNVIENYKHDLLITDYNQKHGEFIFADFIEN